MSLLDSAYYTLVVASGRLAASVKFSHVVRAGDSYRKWRKPWAGALLKLANGYLWVTRAGLRILTGGDWVEWELAVHREALDRRLLVEEGQVLVTPRVPGTVLFDLLRSEREASLKQAALAAALRELHRLHQVEVKGSPLTHSDAATHNVCYDVENGRAYWLDFESRHVGRSLRWRRVHDLLAFTCSAASALPPEQFSLLVPALREGYPDPALLKELVRRLEGWRGRPVELQLVQAPWDYRRVQRLQAYLAALSLT